MPDKQAFIVNKKKVLASKIGYLDRMSIFRHKICSQYIYFRDNQLKYLNNLSTTITFQVNRSRKLKNAYIYK